MHSDHHEQQQIRQKQNVHETVFLQNIQILPSISKELPLILQHNLGKQPGRLRSTVFNLSQGCNFKVAKRYDYLFLCVIFQGFSATCFFQITEEF